MASLPGPAALSRHCIRTCFSGFLSRLVHLSQIDIIPIVRGQPSEWAGMTRDGSPALSGLGLITLGRRMTLAARMMLLLVCVAAAKGEAFGAAGDHARGQSASGGAATITADDLGVEIIALRPIAADRMLEMRFRVIDAEKSLRLLGRTAGHSLYLVDAKSGRALGVPSTKVGTLRQATVRPVPGKIYFAMFNNPGIVRPGEEVTLVVGESRLPGLLVQSKTGMSPPPDEKAREEPQGGTAESTSAAADSDRPPSGGEKPPR